MTTTTTTTTLQTAPPPGLLPALPAAGSMSWATTLRQSAREALRGIAAHKFRSALTMLGLVVTVCGVMVIDAVGKGASIELSGMFTAAGANLVSITSVAPAVNGVQVGAATTLTNQDAQAVAKLPHVTSLSVTMSPHVNGKSQVVAAAQNWSTVVLGVFPDIGTIHGAAMAQGSFFTAQDETAGATSAVLGATVAQNLFPGGSAVGQPIRITTAAFQSHGGEGAPAGTPRSATNFSVAGVMRPQGAGLLGNDPDDVVYVPFSTAQQRLLGKGNGTFGNLYLQVDQNQNIAGVMAAATKAIQQDHHIAPGAADDFLVTNFAAAVNQFASVIGTVKLVLGGITALALLIGGFGIVNVMLASVARRTHEIGIRMAVGAQRKDVLLQFLAEAAVLALLGGLIGVAAGYGLVLLLLAGIPATSTLGGASQLLPGVSAVLVALVVSIGAGVVFGYLPARRAAGLDPVQALRHS